MSLLNKTTVILKETCIKGPYKLYRIGCPVGQSREKLYPESQSSHDGSRFKLTVFTICQGVLMAPTSSWPNTHETCHGLHCLNS